MNALERVAKKTINSVSNSKVRQGGDKRAPARSTPVGAPPLRGAPSAATERVRTFSEANTVSLMNWNWKKALISSALSITVALVSASSLAQQLEPTPAQISVSAAMQERVAPVVYRNAAIENLAIEQASTMVESANPSRKLRVFRAADMKVANQRCNTFVSNDRLSFAVNAPTPRVNGALTLAGTALQSEVNESVAAWAQMLSLVATRKISAEFAYAAKIDKNSSFDSVIAYKLHQNSDSGKPVVVASIKYGVRF